jgi:hypothetical protein
MDELHRQIRDIERQISSSPTSIAQAQLAAYQRSLSGLDSINATVAKIAATHSAVLWQNPLQGISRVIDAINEHSAKYQASIVSDIVRQQKSIENAASATAKVFATISPIRLAETSVLATVVEANRKLAAIVQGPTKLASIASFAGSPFLQDIGSLLTPRVLDVAAESIARQFGPLQASPLKGYLTKAYESDVTSAWEDEALQAEQQEVLTAVAASNFDKLSFGKQIDFLIRRSNEAKDVEKQVLFREWAFSLVLSAFVDYFQPKWASTIYLIVSTVFTFCVRRVGKGLDLLDTKDDIITNDCRMMDRPRRKGKMIARIPKYTTVLIQEKQKKWIHVAVVDSGAKIKVFGWVRSKYVDRA